MIVSFNSVNLIGNELRYIKKSIANCHLSGDGPFTKYATKLLQRTYRPSQVLLTSSCTHALELAALLADIKSGDEVIVPSFTFPSTVNAFVLRGAIPKFVDIRSDTFNIDETKIEAAITKRTRAICVVHYGGVPCEMREIVRLARKHKLFLIEDAAQAFLSEYHRRPVGTFGEFSAVSFHETKNVVCGEGGAIIINKEQFVRRAEIIRQKGTNRAAFYRGEVDKYSWVDIGSSFVPSELQTAYLAAQLEKKNAIWRMRKAIWNQYDRNLRLFEKSGVISLQKIPPHCRSSFHLFAIVFPSEHKRQSAIRDLQKKGIHAIFHYFPLHLSKMGRRFGYKVGMLPVTERISSCLLRLPLHNYLGWPEQRFVIESLAQNLRK